MSLACCPPYGKSFPHTGNSSPTLCVAIVLESCQPLLKRTRKNLTDYIAVPLALWVSISAILYTTLLPITMTREDRSGEFTGVLGFFICICTLLVLLRCYCKLVIVKNFAADDYFSVLTLISFLVFCTFALLGVQNGTGKRRYLIPDEKLPLGMKVCSTTSTAYSMRLTAWISGGGLANLHMLQRTFSSN
jgi:hypothetical protein